MMKPGREAIEYVIGYHWYGPSSSQFPAIGLHSTFLLDSSQFANPLRAEGFSACFSHSMRLPREYIRGKATSSSGLDRDMRTYSFALGLVSMASLRTVPAVAQRY